MWSFINNLFTQLFSFIIDYFKSIKNRKIDDVVDREKSEVIKQNIENRYDYKEAMNEIDKIDITPIDTATPTKL